MFTDFKKKYFSHIVTSGKCLYKYWKNKKFSSKKILENASRFFKDKNLVLKFSNRMLINIFAYALELRLSKKYKSFFKRLFCFKAYKNEQKALQSLKELLQFNNTITAKELIYVEVKKCVELLSERVKLEQAKGGDVVTNKLEEDLSNLIESLINGDELDEKFDRVDENIKTSFDKNLLKEFKAFEKDVKKEVNILNIEIKKNQKINSFKIDNFTPKKNNIIKNNNTKIENKSINNQKIIKNENNISKIKNENNVLNKINNIINKVEKISKPDLTIKQQEVKNDTKTINKPNETTTKPTDNVTNQVSQQNNQSIQQEFILTNNSQAKKDSFMDISSKDFDFFKYTDKKLPWLPNNNESESIKEPDRPVVKVEKIDMENQLRREINDKLTHDEILAIKQVLEQNAEKMMNEYDNRQKISVQEAVDDRVAKNSVNQLQKVSKPVVKQVGKK